MIGSTGAVFVFGIKFSKVDQLPVKRLIDSRFLLSIPDDADRSHILLIVS